MPKTSGEVEPNPLEDQRVSRYSTWWVWVLIVVYVAYVVYLFWDEDRIKLHGLHSLTRLLQAIAHTAGKLALQTEDQYYGYVQSLH